jgi:hypothetical protein
MLILTLGVHWKDPVRAGSLWNNVHVLVMATRVSGRCEYGFQAELHFAEVMSQYAGWNDSERSIHQVQHSRRMVCGPFILTMTSLHLEVAFTSGVLLYRLTGTWHLTPQVFKVKPPCHLPTFGSQLTND